MTNNLRKMRQRLAQIGRGPLSGFFQQRKDSFHLTWAIASRQKLSHILLKGKHPNRVALQGQIVGKSRRKSPGVVHLGVFDRAILHRLTLIDNDVASSIGLILKLLDVEPIAPGVQFPIDGTWVVPFAEGSVFTELNGESMERTSVQPVVKTINNRLGPQLHILDTHQRRHIYPGICRLQLVLHARLPRMLFHRLRSGDRLFHR